MSTNDRFEKSILSVPPKVAEAIHSRCVNTSRQNMAIANKLHEFGGEFAMSNNLDNALCAWMLLAMTKNGATPREAIEQAMELITESIFPRFINIPMVREMAIKEMAAQKDTGESAVMSQVNDMLRNAGYEPLIVAGDSIDEIIDQLVGLRDSQGETKQ